MLNYDSNNITKWEINIMKKEYRSSYIKVRNIANAIFTINYYCTPLILIDFMCGLNIEKK